MKRKILILMPFLLIVMATVAHATGERDNLKGLKGVFLVIDPLSPDLEKRGVTRDELQTRLVVKLRQAGIGILSVKEASRTPGQPILQLKVASVKKTTGDGFVIQLWMNEKVIFDRDRSRIVHGITWIQTTIAFDGELQSRGIYDSVDEVLNELINDYLAANPKISPGRKCGAPELPLASNRPAISSHTRRPHPGLCWSPLPFCRPSCLPSIF